MNNDRSELIEVGPSVDVQEGGINLQQYLQVLLKRTWLILAALALVLVAMAAWTYSQTKIYRSTATVIVNRRAPQVLGKDVGDVVDLSMGTYWSNKEYMKTQENVISSKALATTVVKQLKLAQDRQFWGEPRASKDSTPMQPRSVSAAASKLRSTITSSTMRDSNIIQISVEHSSPTVAARLANAVSQAYMDQNVRYKLESTTDAVKWLATQLDDLKKEFEKNELALYNFRKDNNIISVSMEDKQSLIVRRIGKLSDALTESRLKKIGLNSRRRQLVTVVKRDPLEMAVLPVLNNDTIQKLKDRYLAVHMELRSLEQRYGEKYPQLKEKKMGVEMARADLAREVRNVVAALDAEILEIRDTEGSIAGSLQAALNEALELNKKEMSYRQLKREYENADKLYTMVLTRMKESDLSAQLRVNNIRPLDRAVESRVPVRPQVKTNLMIGALVGLLLGIGLAFLVEATDTSVKSQEDVEKVPGLVYLGLVPRIPGQHTMARNRRRPAPKPEADLIVHRNPKSQVAESCRAIRTNLLFASPDRLMKRILITSAGPREGKTTSAVSLAITMAQSGSRVVLVDTDMRRPRMHKVFQLSGGEGITSVLLGAVGLDDVIKATEVPGLSLLTCGPTPPNPAEVCQSDRFKSLLDELCSRYDRVILDSPPVMVVTDATVLSTLVDGVMLVARTGLTRKMDLRESSRQLLDVGSNLLGCVLNDMDLDKRRYGYYRYKRYGYKRYGYGHYGNYGDKEEAAG